ncbi:MAG TPA: phosphoglycerate mutase family protein [Caulobacteraceae bacterium]|jgi:broad specificity phosphatase PhoE|nr:phosphoglycerate mutase family protein [Caulobacteraceae bacterium]
MNRLILIRHGGSTGNEDPSFYNYNDSALCLTTNGIRQALNTAGIVVGIEPRWAKPGNFALEVFASEYFRTQQTCRIVLDQMGLLSMQPSIRPLLNERDYGTTYDSKMDTDAAFDGNGCESGAQARVGVRGFLDEIADLLDRADVLAFSHYGAIRALVANLLDLSDAEMMSLDVPNGGAFLFNRAIGADGKAVFTRKPLPDHVLPKTAAAITVPPAAPPPR